MRRIITSLGQRNMWPIRSCWSWVMIPVFGKLVMPQRLTLGRLLHCDSTFHIPKETSLAAQSCSTEALPLTLTFPKIHFLISGTVSTEPRLIPTSRAIKIFLLSAIQEATRSEETSGTTTFMVDLVMMSFLGGVEMM